MQSVRSDHRPASDCSFSEVTGGDTYGILPSSISRVYSYDLNQDNDDTPSNPPRRPPNSKLDSPYVETPSSRNNEHTAKQAQGRERTYRSSSGDSHSIQVTADTPNRITERNKVKRSGPSPVGSESSLASHSSSADIEDIFDDSYDEYDQVNPHPSWTIHTATEAQYSGTAGNTYYQTARRILKNATVRSPYVKLYIDRLDDAHVQHAKRVVNTTSINAAKAISKHATAAIGAIGNAADSFIAAHEIGQYQLGGNNTYDQQGEEFVAIERAAASHPPGRQRDTRSKKEHLAEHFGVSVVHTDKQIRRSEEEQVALLERPETLKRWKVELEGRVKSGVAESTFEEIGTAAEDVDSMALTKAMGETRVNAKLREESRAGLRGGRLRPSSSSVGDGQARSRTGTL